MMFQRIHQVFYFQSCLTKSKSFEIFPLSKMKNAVLTFDDASRSHFEFAVPLLKQYGFGIRFARTTEEALCTNGTDLTRIPAFSISNTREKNFSDGLARLGDREDAALVILYHGSTPPCYPSREIV